MWYHFTNLSLHCVSRNVFSLEFNKAPHSSILSMDIFFICAGRFFDSMSLQLYCPFMGDVVASVTLMLHKLHSEGIMTWL